MNISEESKNFIIDEESGGKDYYEKVYKKTFTWPGGASGPTAMIGVDCAYYTDEELTDIFDPYTTDEELVMILGSIGQRGAKGRAYTRKLKGIDFEWPEALQVFDSLTLPKFTALTERVYPGVNELCPNAQGALLSLVFNRGTDLRGERRKEMLAIRPLVVEKDYKGIAKELRSMKRLWAKTNGVYSRREREAVLVESCA